MAPLLELPYPLKIQICSFLSPHDAISWSQSSKRIYDDLALAQLPAMEIPFQSWYHDDEKMKKGPKIPFLGSRTHSVTLSGSWSCRLGELQHVPTNSYNDSQFYIVAYPTDHYANADVTCDNSKEKLDCLDGGRIVCRVVWKNNKPFVQQHHHATAESSPAAEIGTKSNNNNDWIKFTATFMPIPEEEYYLCIQPAPTTDAFQTNGYHHWWRHSLHVSNLVAHNTYHDVNSQFLMKRQYKSILYKSQQQRRVTTKMLGAVARSIRLQLARCSPCWDPVLESFFQTTGIPRDTDSLLVLEEIARFLSEYNDANTNNYSITAPATMHKQRRQFPLLQHAPEELTNTKNITTIIYEGKEEDCEGEEEEEQLQEENDVIDSIRISHEPMTTFNSEWAHKDIDDREHRRGLLKRTVRLFRRFPFPKTSHIKRKRVSHRYSWKTESIASDFEYFS